MFQSQIPATNKICKFKLQMSKHNHKLESAPTKRRVSQL